MDKNNKSLAVFFFGTIMGGILGILYAPDKGENTREKLLCKLSHYKNILEEFLDNLLQEQKKETFPNTETTSQENTAISVAKNKAERLLEDVDELLSQIQVPKK